MMRESLLFNLHSHRLQSGVEADPNRFREVYQSKYGKVRVFKIMSVSLESKRWVADRQNLLCDHNESWFCRGQYPPSLNKILAEKRDFSQLEDFNKDIDDSEYQKQYFENLKYVRISFIHNLA
jgi:dolichyl-diphosphooligosaccharide--protein glycosyltransferase